ncbi:MAG: hypothetical protein MAG795_00506 [Candidatus Woesearchaeota archaeon]|nr:hypothetical protein [Candidatus Woesearchaeota archaeon]
MRELEKMGIPVNRVEVTLNSSSPHDESISYNIAVNFYGKERELKYAIKEVNSYIKKLLKIGSKKKISLAYSIAGNLFYTKGNYKMATGYFIESIKYNRKDLTNWVELFFAIRAMGKFELFEKCIFNIEAIYDEGQNQTQFGQKQFLELVEKVSTNGK